MCYNPYMSKKIEKNEKGIIKISVRDLVEFILREGDIDNRRGRGTSAEAMLAGGRIHRKIQKRMGSNYHAEVPLKIAIEEEEYQLVIEGRADGILIESAEEEITFADNFNHMTMPSDCKVTIDEIKGMYMKLDLLEDAVGVQLAQAMCYAYIYALQHDLAAISVQMTYCNLDTEDIRYFHYDYTFEELADWFEKLINEYKKWADFQFAWKKTAPGIDQAVTVSVSLSGRTERISSRCISHDQQKKESVYSGTDRGWKNDLDRISGSQGSRGGFGG